jgi:hypothetical protein
MSALVSLPRGSRRRLLSLHSKARLKSVQPAPLEPPQVFAPPVGDLGTAAPPYEDAPSNMVASSNACPDGYDYGGYQATRFNSSQVDNRECDARVEYRYHQATHALRLRPDTWTRIRRHSAIPMHMAKAIVCPMLRPRERAKRHQRSTAWKASSVLRVPPPSNFSRFSVRVS